MAKKKRQKKAFYLILAIIILLALAGLFFLRSCFASGDGLAGKAVEILTANAQCKESDNGKDPDNPGVIAWRTKTATSRITNWARWMQAKDLWDSNKNKLVEHYCGSDGKPKIEYFTCDFGYQKTPMNYLEKVNGKVIFVEAYSCKVPPVCGNGIKEGEEECDDGDILDGDGCDSGCKIKSTCGNGIIEPGENCQFMNGQCTFAIPAEIKPVGTKSTDSICARAIYFSAPIGTLANTKIKDDDCLSFYKGYAIVLEKDTGKYQNVIIEESGPAYGPEWSQICEKEDTEIKNILEVKNCIDSQKKSSFADYCNYQFLDFHKIVYPFPESSSSSLFIAAGKSYTGAYWLRIDPEFKNQVKTISLNLTITLKKLLVPDENYKYKKSFVYENIQDQTIIAIPMNFPLPGMYDLFGEFKAESIDGTIFARIPFPDSVEVFPSFPAPKLYSFKSNLESSEVAIDPNKINLIFMAGNGWQGMPEQERIDELKIAMGKALYGNISFFSVEPFHSNADKFNVWYSLEAFDTYASPNILGIDDLEKKGTGAIGKYQKFMLGLNLPKPIVIRLDRQETNDPKVGIMGNACMILNAIQIFVWGNTTFCNGKGYSLPECYEKIHIGGTLLHEFGHKIAHLGEEYNTSDLIEDSEIYFKKNFCQFNEDFARKTSFYPNGLISIKNDCKENQLTLYIKEYACKPSVETVKFCMESAPWKDLLGNGCGQEGIIDCPASNPNNKMEISCHYTNGGYPKEDSYANVIKPTGISIMDHVATMLDVQENKFNYDTTYEPKDRLFGQANERELCRALRTYTGSAWGICQELCLDGCPDGLRCVKGQCLPPPGEDMVFS